LLESKKNALTGTERRSISITDTEARASPNHIDRSGAYTTARAVLKLADLGKNKEWSHNAEADMMTESRHSSGVRESFLT